MHPDSETFDVNNTDTPSCGIAVTSGSTLVVWVSPEEDDNCLFGIGRHEGGFPESDCFEDVPEVVAVGRLSAITGV